MAHKLIKAGLTSFHFRLFLPANFSAEKHPAVIDAGRDFDVMVYPKDVHGFRRDDVQRGNILQAYRRVLQEAPGNG